MRLILAHKIVGYTSLLITIRLTQLKGEWTEEKG